MEVCAVYTRLSKEDLSKINQGDDSESIQNQKLLLYDYAIEHSMQIYKVYTDDDFSGADKDRPSWNEMLSDAENGRFNTIICKTQSRFCRDMGLVEKYIHEKFVEWSIRFIGVTDNIDTNVKGNKKARQIKGLVDEWYLEDISDSIKSVFRKKMKDGQFLGSFACYGYMKDPNDRHKIIIDEEAAKVVRSIFDLYLEGYSIKHTANILTEQKTPTPTQYKQTLGFKYQNCNSSYSTTYGIWGISTVKRILNNKAYIGYLIQGREKKVSYKSKKVVIAPECEWVVIENSHEAIIDTAVFYQVQQLLISKRRVSTNSDSKNKAHCLAGKVKCLDCGAIMVRTGGSNRNGQSYIRCQLAHKTKNKECTTHTISLQFLITKVSEEIQELINSILDKKDNKELMGKMLSSRVNASKTLLAKTKELKSIQPKLEELANAIGTIYLDKVKGLITEDNFILLKDTFERNISQLKEDQIQLEKEISALNSVYNTEVDIISLAKKYTNFKELTGDIVAFFIEYIEVGTKDIYGNREINIYWNV